MQNTKWELLWIVPMVLVALLLTGFALSIICKLQELRADQLDYSKHTDPLPAEIVQDLCAKFVEAKNDPRCAPNAVVYDPQFFDTIQKKVDPRYNRGLSPAQVEQWLGRYKLKCGAPVEVNNVKQYYSCSYALGKSQVYPFLIFYNMDGSIQGTVFSGGSS